MKFKSFKKIVLLSMITAFVFAGIVACGGGQDITGSRSVDTVVDEPTTDQPTTPDNPTTPDDPTPDNPETPSNPTDLGDNNGDHNSTTWNLAETKGKAFYGASYRSVYVPLNMGQSGKWIGVSYNDTDRLTRLWKAMIDKGIRDGKRRMYIKTGDGDLFFDANYNVRWSKKPDVIMKRFQGGAMVRLAEGYGDNDHSAREYDYKYSGSYAIGGLYTFADSLYNVNNKYHSESLNYFFNWRYNTTGGYQLSPENQQYVAQTAGGAMELLVLHPGYPLNLGSGKYLDNPNTVGSAYAVQTYKEKNQTDIGYRDGNHHLYNIKGNTPERYMPAMGVHQLYHLGYRWGGDKSYYPDMYN